VVAYCNALRWAALYCIALQRGYRAGARTVQYVTERAILKRLYSGAHIRGSAIAYTEMHYSTTRITAPYRTTVKARGWGSMAHTGTHYTGHGYRVCIGLYWAVLGYIV